MTTETPPAVDGLGSERGTRSADPAEAPVATLARKPAKGRRGAVADMYPLSPMQQGMVFHTALDAASAVYFEQLVCTLTGELDHAAFERAWRLAVERHAVLRTAFFWRRREEPFQVVFATVELPWQRLDWSGLAGDEQERRLAVLLRDDQKAGFDLESPPLMRLTLIDLGGERRRLVWSFHHLLLDGWSMPLLLSEVLTGYETFRRGETPRLPPVRPYREYIAWLRRQDLGEAERFWRRYLAGFSAPTPVTLSHPWAPPAGGPVQEERFHHLSRPATDAVTALARRTQVTVSTVARAAWALLLARTSREPEVVFGTTVSGRPPELPGVASMVGLFINTLPVRVRLATGAAVGDLLRRLHAEQGELARFEYSPLVSIQGWSEVPRDAPLFDSLLVFENYPVDASMRQHQGSIEISDVRFLERANYPLVAMVEPGERLRLRLMYDPRRFGEDLVRRMLRQLGHLFEAFAADPERRLGEVGLLDRAERHQVLYEWNDTRGPHREATLHGLLAAAAARHPDAPAVADPRGGATYRQVDERSDRIARALRAAGVGPGTLVAIHMRRGADMVPALYGILKAGGAYVPVEPAWPDRRVEWILAATGARHAVADAPLGRRLAGLEGAGELDCLLVLAAAAEAPRDDRFRVLSDDDLAALPPGPPPSLSDPGDLAYVIFTSGSTGTPKGVMVRHRPVINLLDWVNETFDVGPADRVLCVASLSFDLSVYDVFGPLAVGGSVRIAGDDELAEPARLVEILRREPVTFWDSAPAALQQLAPLFPAPGEAADSHLRLVFLSGDWVPLGLPDDVRRAFPRARVIALGGATEATIWSNVFPVETVAPSWVSVPYGRPIRNARYHVLDAALGPCPVAVPGDLYIGGDCLSTGYLGAPRLTAVKYRPDPFADRPGAVLYRTGDQARHWPDGHLEFLGRLDHQVKVRGFRIELGEIEAVLEEHPAVADAVALVRDGAAGERRIVAYVVPSGGEAAMDEAAMDEAALRAHLEERLPVYMLPAAWVALPVLPLTANGKVDRKALPDPEEVRDEAPGAAGAPRNPVEEMVADVFAEVLGRDEVAADGDFFELGGHSLLATRVVSRLRRVLGVEVPLATLFESPTVAALAAAVDALRRGPADLLPAVAPVARDDGVAPLSFAQRRLWFMERLAPGSGAYNVAVGLRLRGDLDVAALAAAVGGVVARHEVLRTTFPLRDGKPVQLVHPAAEVIADLRPRRVDLGGLAAAPREAEVHRLRRRLARLAFDLETGPLLRVALLRLAGDEHAVFLTLHHVVADGWSVGVLVREVGALYAAVRSGAAPRLPKLPVQYADYAVWQHRHLAGEALAEQLAYWRQRLGSRLPEIELPDARPRGDGGRYRGADRWFELDAALSRRLKELARRQGVTLFMLLLAAFQTLLHRLTGAEDVVVGGDVANRNRAELEPLIGFFVNQLVLRGDLSGDPTFGELLQRVRALTLEAYEHQDLPFDRLVEALRPDRSDRRSPLFRVAISHQNTGIGSLELPGLEVSPVAPPARPAPYDLSLFSEESEGRIRGYWNYDADLLDAGAVERLARRFESLLAEVAADPGLHLSELRIREPAPRRPAMTKTAARPSFKSFKPKPVRLDNAELVKTRPGSPEGLPLILEPAVDDLDVHAWVEDGHDMLMDSLHRHGALLFRGFDLTDAERFERFARLLIGELFNENGEHPRETVDGEVYTPVFYPPEKQLLWHNENSFNHSWPQTIIFCAVRPADEGGETPVVDSRRVYAEVDEDVRREFEEKGVMYVRNYGTGLGLDWRQVFGAGSRAAAEQACRDGHMEFEWHGDVLRTRAVRPAVIRHPVTGEKSWFNQAQHFHVACLDAETRSSLADLFSDEADMPRNCYFGDGSKIPDETMLSILDVYRRLEVAQPWERGNVMVVDNVLCAHGRNPFRGERKLLVALGDMHSYDDGGV